MDTTIRPSSPFLKSGAILAEGDNITIAYDEDTHGEVAFYAPDFFLKDPQPWHYYKHHLTLTRQELQALLKPHPLQTTWSNPKTAPFEQSISDLSLKKVVPYAATTSSTRPDLAHALFNLLNNPNLYIYGFWNPREGILGATPELLFRRQGDHIQTMACAGTSSSLGQLLKSSKDRHEHQVVVDDIVQQLSDHGEPEIAPTNEVAFPGLYHLITPIEMHTNASFETLIKSLHPTPALGGSPRTEAMNWLVEYDKKIPRGRFGAPFAIKKGNTETCLVAIRNMQWKESGASIMAGCGVVGESQIENEVRELHLKLYTIKKMLGIIHK